MLIRLLASVFAIIAADAHVEAATSPHVVELAVLADGSIRVEGHRYVGQSAIDAEVERLCKRRPQVGIHVRVDKLAPYDAVAKVLANMQKDGVLTIGIVNTQQ